ncbi:MAG TPA: hypothetical protein VMU81_07800 [Acetobacteraceae bacterium]|nr:hypothetical protein [Acetobacteraceae bacterium]
MQPVEPQRATRCLGIVAGGVVLRWAMELPLLATIAVRTVEVVALTVRALAALVLIARSLAVLRARAVVRLLPWLVCVRATLVLRADILSAASLAGRRVALAMPRPTAAMLERAVWSASARAAVDRRPAGAAMARVTGRFH